MNPLTSYFHAEKTESLGFLGAGLAGVIVAIFWWTSTSPTILQGAAWSLFFAGFAQLLVGGVVFFRTDRQVSALKALAEESPDAFRIEELERMHRVSQNFIRIRWIEMGLFITSGIMIMMFFPTKGFWFGLALALSFESVISLTFDFFAEERALHYKEFVKRVA